MKKNKKKQVRDNQKRLASVGVRFEGTKVLLSRFGLKVLKTTVHGACNVAGCGEKLTEQRMRWCPEHRLLTNQIRNLAATYKKRGQSLKTLPKRRFNVRNGKLTLQAKLMGVDAEKAVAKYKTGQRGLLWSGQLTAAETRKQAGKKASLKLRAAAKRAIKKVAKLKEQTAKPAPKKVPAPNLSAMKNGKGAAVQAAVQAHVAAKQAAAAKK